MSTNINFDPNSFKSQLSNKSLFKIPILKTYFDINQKNDKIIQQKNFIRNGLIDILNNKLKTKNRFFIESLNVLLRFKIKMDIMNIKNQSLLSILKNYEKFIDKSLTSLIVSMYKGGRSLDWNFKDENLNNIINLITSNVDNKNNLIISWLKTYIETDLVDIITKYEKIINFRSDLLIMKSNLESPIATESIKKINSLMDKNLSSYVLYILKPIMEITMGSSKLDHLKSIQLIIKNLKLLTSNIETLQFKIKLNQLDDIINNNHKVIWYFDSSVYKVSPSKTDIEEFKNISVHPIIETMNQDIGEFNSNTTMLLQFIKGLKLDLILKYNDGIPIFGKNPSIKNDIKVIQLVLSNLLNFMDSENFEEMTPDLKMMTYVFYYIVDVIDNITKFTFSKAEINNLIDASKIIKFLKQFGTFNDETLQFKRGK